MSNSTCAANPIPYHKLTLESIEDAIKLSKSIEDVVRLSKDLIKADIDGIEYQLRLLNNEGEKMLLNKVGDCVNEEFKKG